MINKKIIKLLFVICVLAINTQARAQHDIVINNKGTKIITNNSVITANTAPTTPAPIQGDVWFDTTDPENHISNIWDGTTWIPIPPVSFKIEHAEYRINNMDINGSAAATVRDFFPVEFSNDGSAISKTSNSRLTINEEGYYQLNFNCSIVSSVARSNPEAILFINGSATRVRSSSGYIRSISGHNESSLHFSYMQKFNTGDYIEISTRRLARTGTVTAQSDGTVFTITKVGM